MIYTYGFLRFSLHIQWLRFPYPGVVFFLCGHIGSPTWGVGEQLTLSPGLYPARAGIKQALRELTEQVWDTGS